MPDYSIIIPAPAEDEARHALAAVRESCPPECDAELILALGQNPSRQRNAAAAQATGQYLIFLDNDCKVDASFWQRLEELRRDFDFDVAGGPILLEEPSLDFEKAAQAALANPKVTGESAARYAPVGPLRTGHQFNLILANMAVNREVFEISKGFDECLYPNEENEWLHRLETAVPGACILYDPALTVRRPQRKTPARFHHAFLRYGAGRAKQAKISGHADATTRLLKLGTFPALFVFFVFLYYMPVFTVLGGALAYVFYLFSIWSTVKNVPDHLRMKATLQGMMISFHYVLGFWMGQLFGWPKEERWMGEVDLRKESLGGTQAATPPAAPAAAEPASSATKAPPPPETPATPPAAGTPATPSGGTSSPPPLSPPAP